MFENINIFFHIDQLHPCNKMYTYTFKNSRQYLLQKKINHLKYTECNTEVYINCNYMKIYYSLHVYKMQLVEFMSAFVTHLNRT